MPDPISTIIGHPFDGKQGSKCHSNAFSNQTATIPERDPTPYTPTQGINKIKDLPINAVIHKDVRYYQDFIQGTLSNAGQLFIGDDITVEQIERIINLAFWYLYNPRRNRKLDRSKDTESQSFEVPKTPLGNISTIPDDKKDFRYREDNYAFLGKFPVYDQTEVLKPEFRKEMSAGKNVSIDGTGLEAADNDFTNDTYNNWTTLRTTWLEYNSLATRPKLASIEGSSLWMDKEHSTALASSYNAGKYDTFPANGLTFQYKPISADDLVRTIKVVAKLYASMMMAEYYRQNKSEKKFVDKFFLNTNIKDTKDSAYTKAVQAIDDYRVENTDSKRDVIPGEEISLQKLFSLVLDVSNIIYSKITTPNDETNRVDLKSCHSSCHSSGGGCHSNSCHSRSNCHQQYNPIYDEPGCHGKYNPVCHQSGGCHVSRPGGGGGCHNSCYRSNVDYNKYN